MTSVALGTALNGARVRQRPATARPAPALARSSRQRNSLTRSQSLSISATALAGEKERLQSISNLDKVAILAEALPYLQKFHGKTVVIKYGGAAMKDGSLKEGVIRDLVLLATVGIRPVLVHGGGPEINGWLQKLNIEPRFLNGLRVTDGPTMEIVEMVLSGKVNKSLVSLINQAGGTAVGLSGKDGNLLRGRIMDPALGFVGEVTNVDAKILHSLLQSGVVPVVATVATDETGQALNINADTAAAEIAAALSAEKLILMTDVMGVLKDKDDPSTLIPEVSINGVRKLIKDGIVGGGMIPKVQCAVRAVAQGVRTCHIIDGRSPHSLLLEVLTEKGSGTMITG